MPFPLEKTKTAGVHLCFSFGALLLSGCTPTQIIDWSSTQTSAEEVPASTHSHTIVLQADYSPDVRQGRYTLARTSPRPDQVDLMNQEIDIRLSRGFSPTVQDALIHLLRHSGYRLCVETSELQQLYSLPLPAAHYHMGPVTLRNALATLAGPAWQTIVDRKTRTVCFETSKTIEPVQPRRNEVSPDKGVTRMERVQ